MEILVLRRDWGWRTGGRRGAGWARLCEEQVFALPSFFALDDLPPGGVFEEVGKGQVVFEERMVDVVLVHERKGIMALDDQAVVLHDAGVFKAVEARVDEA